MLKGNPDLVFSKHDDGTTPLHVAAVYGHKNVAELLLTNKADANAKDDFGNTPLCYAVDKGFKDIAELLPQHDGHE